MKLTADRLEVTEGERIRVALLGSTWTVTASPHVAGELEDVGFRVISLSDTLPAGDDWTPGALDVPASFPQTALWAELEAKASASYQFQLTEDLYVLHAWEAPGWSSSSTSSSSSGTSAHPLHPYDVDPVPPDPVPPAVVEGRVMAFRRAYVWGRGVVAS